MMAAVEGDTLDPRVERDYRAAINKHAPEAPASARVDRAEKAFTVVMTGETAKYGNTRLKKGVTPVQG